MKTFPYIIPLIIFYLSIHGCKENQHTYTVSGFVHDSSHNGKTVYINRHGTFDKIDSTKIKENRYIFTGKTDTAQLCYLSVPGQKSKCFILEKGNIFLPSQYSQRPSGTPMNDALTYIRIELDNLDSLYRQKSESLNHLNIAEETIEQEWDPFLYHYKETLQKHYREICLSHPNDALGHYAVIAFIDKIGSTVKREIYSQMGPSIQANHIFQHDKKKLDNEMKAGTGMPFIDFKGKTMNGKRISLSDYIGKGKPVVMDIWASWCVPCRKEIPHLRKLYQEFHQDGLEIVGVFIKDKAENLKKMIVEEGVLWPQIMDETGKILQLYGATQVPQIILFDANGTIVKRNLHDRELIQTVKKHMQTQR